VEFAQQRLAAAVRMRTAQAEHATVASGDRASFARVLADYRQVADGYTLRMLVRVAGQLRRAAKTMMLER
jgi:hypothetical protein